MINISPKTLIMVGAIVVALGAIGGAYLKGRSDENRAAEVQARRDVVEQITERNRINDNVSRMSASDLCRQLGGVFVNGICE